MHVAMWMTPSPVTVLGSTTIGAAAEILAAKKFRRLLVVNETGDLAGIVTYTDVARACPADINPHSTDVSRHPSLQRPISEIMASNPKVIAPDAPIEQAARMMRENRIGGLPVVRASKPEGIITESDIFGAFVEVTGAREPGLRITFEFGENPDVLPEIIRIAAEHSVTVTAFLSLHHVNPRTGLKQHLGIVHMKGAVTQGVVSEIWSLGNRVLTVLRQH